MKRFLVLVTAVAVGCGGSGSGNGTDGGGTGDGGDNGGDGGTAGARTVTLTLPNRPTNAAMFSFLVAYQDGNAAWQLAPAPTGDTYSFTINAPSYGVAFTCIGNVVGTTATQQRSAVTSAHFAVGERTDVALDVPPRCSDRMQGGVTLSGNVANRPSGGVLVVQFGGRSTFVGSQTGNFTLQVPPGTRDLIVTHVVPEGNGDFHLDEAVVQRDLAVTANASLDIDFSTSATIDFYPVDASAAPMNARVVASTTLYTANGTTASLVRETQNWETDALAAGDMRSSDVYDQAIAVSHVGSNSTVTHATSMPADQAYVAPAALGTATTTIPARMPYVMLMTKWPAYPDAVGYLWNAAQQNTCAGNLPCSTVWSAYLSPGVTGAAPAYVMPDLSALAGWKDSFQLSSSPIVGSVTAITSSAGAADFPTGVPVAGTDRVFVRSDYGITP